MFGALNSMLNHVLRSFIVGVFLLTIVIGILFLFGSPVVETFGIISIVVYTLFLLGEMKNYDNKRRKDFIVEK